MTDLEPRQSIIDPRTGVVFSIEEVGDGLLVEIFTALEQREKQMQEWRRAAEDELARRYEEKMGERAKDPLPVGANAITVERGWSRTWDGTALQLVVQDLVERGALSLKDIDGLLTTPEPKVDGKKALDLLNRSEGDALMEIRRCFTWKKGRSRVRVTPAAQIEP